MRLTTVGRAALFEALVTAGVLSAFALSAWSSQPHPGEGSRSAVREAASLTTPGSPEICPEFAALECASDHPFGPTRFTQC